MDYKPIPVSYETFSRKQSLSSMHSKKNNTFGSKPQVNPESLGPGPKYSLISTWAPIKGSDNIKKGINYIQSTSNLRSPGIYH